MRHTDTFKRTDELVKGYRALKAAKIFQDHPEVHTVEIYERGGSSGPLGKPPQGTAYYFMARSGQWGKSASLRLSEADLQAAGRRARAVAQQIRDERTQQLLCAMSPVIDWLKEQKLEKCFCLMPTTSSGIPLGGMLVHERLHDVGGSMGFDVSDLSTEEIIAKIEDWAVGHAKVYHKEQNHEKRN